jgi:hypothetical protein
MGNCIALHSGIHFPDVYGSMSTSFAFIPRKLVKKQAQFPPASSSFRLPKGEEPKPPPTKSTIGKKAKATHSDEDHVIFVFLALSDHALWSNPDLSRKIADNSNGGEEPGCTSASLCLFQSMFEKEPRKQSSLSASSSVALRSSPVLILDPLLRCLSRKHSARTRRTCSRSGCVSPRLLPLPPLLGGRNRTPMRACTNCVGRTGGAIPVLLRGIILKTIGRSERCIWCALYHPMQCNTRPSTYNYNDRRKTSLRNTDRSRSSSDSSFFCSPVVLVLVLVFLFLLPYRVSRLSLSLLTTRTNPTTSQNVKVLPSSRSRESKTRKSYRVGGPGTAKHRPVSHPQRPWRTHRTQRIQGIQRIQRMMMPTR